MTELFRFSFDDSGVRKVLDGHTADLKRHEELIEEILKMLKDRPTFADLERMKEDILREMNQKIGDLSDLVNNLQTTMDKRLEQMHNELTALPDKMEQPQVVNTDEIDKKIKELEEKLQLLEKSVQNNTKYINETNNNLETMTNAYAGIIDRKAPLDGNLHQNLNATTQHVKDKFKEIMKRLDDHEERLNAKPSEKVVEREIVNNNNNVDYAAMFDISHLNPDKEFKPTWEMPPKLPTLQKFDSLVDNVDYTYKMVPKLQGFLYSMHERIDDLTANSTDNSGLENLLNNLKDSIKAMERELNSLKNALKKSVSRQDVLDMLREQSEEITGTSVGAVKCIACGRDVTQVAGAMSEIDALKTLGAPPNSIAVFGTTPRITQLYTNDSLDFGNYSTRTADTGIYESPRSSRSYKSSTCRVRRTPRPY